MRSKMQNKKGVSKAVDHESIKKKMMNRKVRVIRVRVDLAHDVQHLVAGPPLLRHVVRLLQQPLQQLVLV